MRRVNAAPETRRELGPYPLVILIAVAVVAVLAGIWLGGWTAAAVTVGVALVLIVAVVVWSARRRDDLGDAPQAAAVDDSVHRALVVADERWGESTLVHELRSHAAGRPLSVFVMAPALESHVGRLTDDQCGYEEAAGRLSEIVDHLKRAGIEARGEVGPSDPLQAADDGLRQFAASEIVFVTHPESDANWLESGVIDRAKSRYAQSVDQIQVLA